MQRGPFNQSAVSHPDAVRREDAGPRLRTREDAVYRGARGRVSAICCGFGFCLSFFPRQSPRNRALRTMHPHKHNPLRLLYSFSLYSSVL